MNLGRLQVLFVPRSCVWFFRPTKAQREHKIYRYIYRWIVYVWPLELRLFRGEQ
jgi:hypothetical protein